MRTVKKTALIVIAFVITVLAIAAFLPDHYSINRSIEINAPAEIVYKQVGDFSTWKEWDPISAKDPNAHQEISGEACQIGHARHFKGSETGEGTIRIAECHPFTLIANRIEMVKPATLQVDDIWEFETTENGTLVNWTSKGSLNYPLGRLYGLMINQLLGGEMESGLDSLKTYTESMIVAPLADPKELLIEEGL